jgi:DNA-binding IclR family transcriptional regulator
MADLTSLEKGLAILRQLASSDQSMSAAELAEATGLNRTTVYRICDVLQRDSWIENVADGRQVARLDLGPSMHGLVALASNKYDMEAKLRPTIDGLSRSLAETVHVGSLEHDELVHVARSLPESGLNMAAQIGSRQPAHLSALGKALLASLSEEEVRRRFPDEALATATPASIATRGALLEHLERIRADGYATEDGESRVGVRCVAAPVFDAHGRAPLAISVTTIPQRLDEPRLGQVVDAVRGAAGIATAALGGRVPPGWGP